MSIDLLPRAEASRLRTRRRLAVAVFLVLVLWGLIGVASLIQLDALMDRQEDRDELAGQVARADADVAALRAFQDMADDVAAGNQVLAFAMADEVSWAELLLDLSRGVPTSTSFTQISGQLVGVAPGGTGQDVFDPGAQTDVGFFTVNGYSRATFTPGLQDLLRRFGAIDGFFQGYLSSAQTTEIGDVEVTDFAAEVRLDESARTDRYVDGLPEPGG